MDTMKFPGINQRQIQNGCVWFRQMICYGEQKIDYIPGEKWEATAFKKYRNFEPFQDIDTLWIAILLVPPLSYRNVEEESMYTETAAIESRMRKIKG